MLSEHFFMYKHQYYFNEVFVHAFDIQCSNGVIFLVDEVLGVPEGTVWQILNNPDYELSKFAAITKAAGKDVRLNATATSTRYTVFAPRDDAFNKIPANDQHYIMSSAYARYLTDYHTHRGVIHPEDLLLSRNISTMHTGFYITFSVDPITGATLLDGRSSILIEDIQADNGMVYVISDVLLPPTMGGITIIG
ncbi:hypothetical protein ACF0H5_010289 [Mactra antiquata]